MKKCRHRRKQRKQQQKVKCWDIIYKLESNFLEQSKDNYEADQ